MNAPTRIVTAQVPAELADKLDAAAARLDRPSDWVVKQALAAWVDLADEHHRMILEGLADVDAGRLIDHAAMLAWADGLDEDETLPTPPQ